MSHHYAFVGAIVRRPATPELRCAAVIFRLPGDQDMTNVKKILQHTSLMLVGLVVASLSAAAPLNAQQVQKRVFQLHPSPTFIACAGVQGGPNPTATVT